MIHRKVQCWIFSRDAQGAGQCLLLKTNRARGEFWQPVTGSVESNEGYFEAACREPAEETGFVFNAAPVDTGYEFEFASRQGTARERIFALVVDDVPAPRLDPKEHQDFRWLDPTEAMGLLRFPSNISGLRHAYRAIFGTDLGKESQ